MLPVNLLNTLKALALDQRPLPTVTTDGASKGFQFEVGQKLAASIQAQVAPGVFKVSVANQLIQMQLPVSLRSGDTVQLQVISVQPRLTFGMVNPESPLATPEQLGPTARLLSSLSQQPPDKAYIQTAKNTPLWALAEPPQAKPLAGLLHDALSNSGLFYESHQALWLEGARSTLQLMQEPQNKLATPGSFQAGSPQTEGVPAKQAGIAPANTDSPVARDLVKPGTTAPANSVVSNQPQNIGTVVSTTDSGPSLITKQEGNVPLSIPEHLRPLVQQQLNALETGQMVWQGNVWPNQPMQWAVHEEAARTPDTEGQRLWVTQIHLDLPNLGGVSTTLRFSGTAVSLIFHADNADTRALLGNASTQLVSAMSNAGIKVHSTQVENT